MFIFHLSVCPFLETSIFMMHPSIKIRTRYIYFFENITFHATEGGDYRAFATFGGHCISVLTWNAVTHHMQADWTDGNVGKDCLEQQGLSTSEKRREMLGLHFYNLLIFTVVFLIDFRVKCCKLQIGTNTVFVIQFVKHKCFYMECMCHPSSEHV